MLDNKTLNNMLTKIEDPQARLFYADIIKGKMKYQVKCMSDSCNGNVVGFISINNKVVEKNNDDYKTVGPKTGVSSFRMRPDGIMGFRCWCGNSSIKAPEEDGIVGAAMPTKEDMEIVFEKISERKASYKETRFIIEDII